MKITYLLFLTAFSCQTVLEPKSVKPPKTKEENMREFEKEFGATKPNWHDYDQHYWFNDSIEGVYQYLGVRVRAVDSIEYLLVTKNQLCDMNWKGKAGRLVDHDSQIKFMSPELENAKNFYEGKNDILVHIQFGQDSSKATIEFVRKGYSDECDPFPNLILDRETP